MIETDHINMLQSSTHHRSTGDDGDGNGDGSIYAMDDYEVESIFNPEEPPINDDHD